MPQITYIEDDGTVHVVDAQAGLSVMENALRNNVPGIDAICGGQLACATCHVYVDAAFVDQLQRSDDDEEDMLDFAANREQNSRLSCQIDMTDELDGLIVRMPEYQGG